MSATARAHQPVAIVGAGPYGLAVAAHLREAGVETRIFGEAMEAWRTQMPKGMLLRSSRRASHIADPGRSLTIDHYERSEGRGVGDPVSLVDFINYGRWFAGEVASDIDPRKVKTVEQLADGFRLTLADQERLRVARVVLATGLSSFERRPPPFAGLPSGLASHSSGHREFASLAGRRVLVIGSGQSALESGALLHEAGALVEILARTAAIHWLADTTGAAPRPVIRFPVPPTGIGGRVTGWAAATPDVYRRLPGRARATVDFRCMRPAGASWLRTRLREVRLTTGRRAVAAAPVREGLRVSLDDGSERLVDHVLLGTGYALDVRRHEFLVPPLVAKLRVRNGHPLLGPGLESSVPGLHFVGAPATMTFGPVMRHVIGSCYAAPAVTRAVLGKRQAPLRFSF